MITLRSRSFRSKAFTKKTEGDGFRHIKPVELCIQGAKEGLEPRYLSPATLTPNIRERLVKIYYNKSFG